MPIVHLRGRVLPSVVQVTIMSLPPVQWDETDANFVMVAKPSVVNSIVDVECELSRYDDDLFTLIYIHAFEAIQTAVDLFCFAHGWGLTILLDKFVKPDGSEKHIFMQRPDLSALSTAIEPIVKDSVKSNPNMDSMYKLVALEPALRMALNDLILSISSPLQAPVNCGRAIDGLSVIMSPSGKDRTRGWAPLREAINADQKYVTFITEKSIAPRHGDRTAIPGPVIAEVTARSWTLMNRFLEYRKRGSQPLPLSEFPLLQG